MNRLLKVACPICNREAIGKFRPFCSKRCADVDLGHWFDGKYRVETEEMPDFSQLPANDDDDEVY